jgi:kynureninase
MQIPAQMASAAFTTTPTADGNNVLGGDAAHPFYVQQASAVAVGPFATTTAASQTAAAVGYGASDGTYVAMRAGSITGFSAMLDAAITGAGTTIVVSVYKNGALVNVALNLTFTQAGGEVKLHVSATPGAYPVAAGDTLSVVYTSGVTTDTPKLVASIEVTQ